MTRLRMMLGSMGAALVVLALAAATVAQGPGGPGGRGGFGGRGGNVLGLLDNAAVQEDIKLTDDQKKKLPEAKDAVTKLRDSIFGPRQQRGNRGTQPAPGGQPAATGLPVPADPTAAAAQGTQPAQPGQGGQPAQGGRNRRGGQGGAGGGTGGGTGGAGGAGGAGGGAGGFGGGGPGGPGFDPTVMQANFANLTKGTEAIYAKVITKLQRERLTQIDLQRQGPLAVLQPEMATRLNISEDQMMNIQEIQSGQREQMQEQMQFMRQQFMGADGQFDRQKMRDFQQSDEGKAQRKQQQTQFDKSQDQLIAVISKTLTKNQKAKFNAMQGKKFDLTKLDAGNNGGPGGTPPAADAAAAAPASTDAPAPTDPPKKGTTKKSTSKKKATAKN